MHCILVVHRNADRVIFLRNINKIPFPFIKPCLSKWAFLCKKKSRIINSTIIILRILGQEHYMLIISKVDTDFFSEIRIHYTHVPSYKTEHSLESILLAEKLLHDIKQFVQCALVCKITTCFRKVYVYNSVWHHISKQSCTHP